MNYIPNKNLKKFTPLSCDRDKSVHSYYCTQSFTISRAKVLRNMKKNPFPFNWMSEKSTYLFQDSCVGDIDFPWQIEATKWWLKKYLKKLKIIIFGGSGFIGSHVAEVLSKLGHNVTIADLKNSSLSTKIKFVKVDIKQENKILKLVKNKDIVYNFAAIADIQESYEDPIKTFKLI